MTSSCEHVQEAGKGKEFQQLLAEIEEAGSEGGALDKACSELQALISSLKVPANLAKEAGKSTKALYQLHLLAESGESCLDNLTIPTYMTADCRTWRGCSQTCSPCVCALSTKHMKQCM